MIYKNREEVKEIGNWSKLYYKLSYYTDNMNSFVLLNYLIDNEEAHHTKCFNEGYEDYLEYTDDWISRSIPLFKNSGTIRNALKNLEQKHFIFIHHLNDKDNGLRFIKLNYELLDQILGVMHIDSTDNSTDNNTDNSTDDSTVDKNYQHIRNQNSEIKTQNSVILSSSTESAVVKMNTLSKEQEESRELTDSKESVDSINFNSSLDKYIYTHGPEAPATPPTPTAAPDDEKPIIPSSKSLKEIHRTIDFLIEASAQVKEALHKFYTFKYEHIAELKPVSVQQVMDNFNNKLKDHSDEEILRGLEVCMKEVKYQMPFASVPFKKSSYNSSPATSTVHSSSFDDKLDIAKNSDGSAMVFE